MQMIYIYIFTYIGWVAICDYSNIPYIFGPQMIRGNECNLAQLPINLDSIASTNLKISRLLQQQQQMKVIKNSGRSKRKDCINMELHFHQVNQFFFTWRINFFVTHRTLIRWGNEVFPTCKCGFARALRTPTHKFRVNISQFL